MSLLEPLPKSNRRKVWEIFLAYIQSMLFAFTGGNITLPLLQQLIGDRYKLASRERVFELFALGQATPGVISLNVGIMLGREIAGWPGALAAVAGCVLPAFVGMLVITATYTYISRLAFVQSIIGGIRAASVAIILQTGIVILSAQKRAFSFFLAACAFVAVFILEYNVILIVLLCGLAGAMRERFSTPDSQEHHHT